MVTMFDTVTIDTVPAHAEAVAGYVGGKWPTYLPLVQRFPHAHHLSIAINASEDADALDIENLDAVPAQAPAWVRRQQARGVTRPVLYASVSAMPNVLVALGGAGIRREEVRLWTAHYTQHEHLCSPGCGFGFTTTANATQWTSQALGRNLDQSVCDDRFFDPPPDPHHYARFAIGPFRKGSRRLYERRTVEEYDRLMAHPHLHRARLRALRADLVWLRKRVWYVSHQSSPPSWTLAYRGWRWQELNRRTR